ncbi:hypothetical protein D030_5256A, partial [Vibrio parahaemolyticus AQ3810]
MGGGKFCV